MEVEVGAQTMEIESVPEVDVEKDWDRSVDELLQERENKQATHSCFESEPGANWDDPASPIRAEWPKDSMLTKDHFTIDEQHCLVCYKKLGYAMPMNRVPKTKYLFCHDNKDCLAAVFLKCWVCGNFQNENTGYLVHRPGNSAYTGPSQIYNFMCHHCYKDQIEMEPGLEETREQFRKYREVRRENEEKEKDLLTLAEGTKRGHPYASVGELQRKRPRQQQYPIYE